jgi:hypothetical protein
MRKILTLLLLISVNLSLFSNNKDLLTEIREIIKSSMQYTDFNPIHKPETDKVTEFFNMQLDTRYNSSYQIDKEKSIDSLFSWIYANGYCVYEDSPDNRRMKIRRAICFATIGLLSDYDKAYTFIEYAKLSLIENINQPDIELLENQYLGLLLLEIMLHLDENQLNGNIINELETFLRVNQTQIQRELYADTKSIVTQIQKKLE